MGIGKVFKEKLGHLLGKGHAVFSGKLAMRRPYREEDEEGGSGAAEMGLPEHPLFKNVQIGASSDMTAITSQYRDAEEALEERQNEASDELQAQPAFKKALSKTHSLTSVPSLKRG